LDKTLRSVECRRVEKESATPQNGALFYVEHSGARGPECSTWNTWVYYAGTECELFH